MNLLNFLVKQDNIRQAINETPAKVKNKATLLIVPYLPPQKPANVFPMKLVKNQTPIINDKNFFGASFDTNDKPIGERQSSASVIIKYTKTNQSGETKEISER